MMMKHMRFADKSIKVRNMSDTIQRSTIKAGLAGQAFTDFTCKLCGETDTWANTATPKICYKCAIHLAESTKGKGCSLEKVNLEDYVDKNWS